MEAGKRKERNVINKEGVNISKNGMTQFFPYFLVLLGACARLLPHAPNFTPIAALAIFGAMYLKRRDALWVPLVAMVLSDAVIGFYNPFVMASVYGSFALVGLMGLWLRRESAKSEPPRYTIVKYRGTGEGEGKKFSWWWPRVIGTSLLGSVLFFLVTNWAVWAFGELYTKDISGLMLSYWMGLPFFRNTVLGDLCYVSLFFGIAEVAPHAAKIYCRGVHALWSGR